MALDPIEIDELRYRFAGTVFEPGDEDYDDARRVWNGAIDLHPAVVARCADAADVIASLSFARERGLRVAVRGGGHNVAGFGTCDGGLVIDLGGMRSALVDPEQRRVRVQGGARLGDLDHAAAAFGMAVPAGVVSHTGVGGLTLGGGVGYLSRKYGYTCDAMLEARVISADGEYLRAAPEENPDLFWAIRGGGGNFGVVTDMTFRLFEERTVLAGPIVHRGSDARGVLAFYRELAAEQNRSLYAHVVLSTGSAPLPDHLHGEMIATLFVYYAGPVREAEAVLEPLRRFGRPELDLVEPRLYVEQQRENDLLPWAQYRMQNYWKAEYLSDLPDDAIETVLEHAAAATSPLSFFMIHPLGGAIDDVGDSDTAVSHRGARHSVLIDALDHDPAKAGLHRSWARAFWESLRPYSAGGGYVNYLADGDRQTVLDAYGAEKYARLVAVKDRFDPTNCFAINQNIRPSGREEDG
jgi:FAD/FMN-containing dehydrogenase